MYFENTDAFYLLVLPLLIFVLSIKKQSYKKYFSDEMFEKIFIDYKKRRYVFVLLLLCYCALILAIARPVIPKQGVLKRGDNVDVAIALDMSKSMQCSDVYPTRFAFAKQKILELIKQAHGVTITLIGFSDFPFLISSGTNDKTSLRYLLKHTYADQQIAMRGSNLLGALKSTTKLLSNDAIKPILIFTDGTDLKNFSLEIAYAKKHKIKVFIFGIGTLRGGALRTTKGFLKDSSGNVVITRLNPAIKALSTQTGGEYFHMNASSNASEQVLNIIRKDYATQRKHNSFQNSQEELFYIPLSVAVLFFLMSLIGVRR